MPNRNDSGRDHVVLDHLCRHFGSVAAVHDISLSIGRGELVSLLGPSGCGKTTTLRMIAGFVAPTSGRISVNGKDVTADPPYMRRMGMVFQDYALFPHLDVFGNVAFGLQMAGVDKREGAERVAATLERVHLGGFERRRIHHLSGGQQQRVALARALVTEPEVLLLDEPLSNLDANLRERMRDEIRSIQEEIGITTLFVTHDQIEALTMSDRVVVLNHGRVEHVGTPRDVYERPASRFVADFIGRANFLHGRVQQGVAGVSPVVVSGGGVFQVTTDLKVGQTVTLMIRPHRVSISAPVDASVSKGRVAKVLYRGDLIQYEVVLGDTHLLVEEPNAHSGAARWKVGMEVAVYIDPDDVLVYDQSN